MFKRNAKKLKSSLLAFLLCFGILSTLVSCGDSTEAPETNSEITTELDSSQNSENQIVQSTESERDSQKPSESEKPTQPTYLSTTPAITESDVPVYTGKIYVALNNNKPSFSTDNLAAISYEYYSELDSLGRCGVVYACVGKDIMPTEERGSIGQVKPTGWHTVKYDIVDGNYLYNRSHLIGFQLTGENANTKNLITGTRQFNVKGMLPFENMVADYVKETGNHVMYRVTPVFEGNNLVAKGVQMEAYSIEDKGDGICFNVFVYNVQDGIEINYATGESKLVKQTESQTPPQTSEPDEAEDLGYTPCSKCYK